jgi:peptidyl-tRNA hydrolase
MLKIWTIVRNDVGMTQGKMCSQASHAAVGAFTNALQASPESIRAYHSEFPSSPGTKVCCQANLAQITRLIEELAYTNIPHFVVYDSGCENFCNGERTLTALGLGPITSDEAPKFLKRLKLL